MIILTNNVYSDQRLCLRKTFSHTAYINNSWYESRKDKPRFSYLESSDIVPQSWHSEIWSFPLNLNLCLQKWHSQQCRLHFIGVGSCLKALTRVHYNLPLMIRDITDRSPWHSNNFCCPKEKKTNDRKVLLKNEFHKLEHDLTEYSFPLLEAYNTKLQRLS